MAEDANKDEGPFEVRFYLKRRFADAVRGNKTVHGMKQLQKVLAKYGAKLENQMDEFQAQLRAWQKIENWEALFPDPQQRANEMRFEKFTMNTLLNDAKREYL